MSLIIYILCYFLLLLHYIHVNLIIIYDHSSVTGDSLCRTNTFTFDTLRTFSKYLLKYEFEYWTFHCNGECLCCCTGTCT